MVGAHAAQRLVQHGGDVALLDIAPHRDYLAGFVDPARVPLVHGDITSLPAMLAAVQEVHPEAIVHTAALLGSAASASPHLAYRVNVEGSVNVLEAARFLGVKRVVYASTMGVYSWVASAPMTEEQPFGPNVPYSVTKLAGEQMALMLGERYGIEVVVLRFAPSYGYTYSAASSVYGSVIEGLIKGAFGGGPTMVNRVEAFQSPTEFVYVRDLAQAIECALRVGGVGQRAFNIGSGELSDLQDFVAAVSAELPEARITLSEPHGPARADPTRFPYDLSRARAELGYVPEFPLRAGIDDYVSTMRDHQRERQHAV
jgi:UDP-glucose 4-epimerase